MTLWIAAHDGGEAVLKKYFKSWGGHHLLVMLVVFGVLSLIPPEYQFAVANATFWINKEGNEARARAGGLWKALQLRRLHREGQLVKSAGNPDGVWEPWDFITPSVSGAIVGPLL